MIYRKLSFAQNHFSNATTTRYCFQFIDITLPLFYAEERIDEFNRHPISVYRPTLLFCV